MNDKTFPTCRQSIWSQMCFLAVAEANYWVGGYDISIVSKDGKYGLIYAPQEAQSAETALCPCEFDSMHNLHIVGPSGCFVCFSGGKCGLLKLCCHESLDGVDCVHALACEYDSICVAPGSDHVLLCYRVCDVHYYNLDTDTLSAPYSSIRIELGIAICEREDRTLLIDTKSDAVIYAGVDNRFLEYCCQYQDGMVFKEGYIELNAGNPANSKEAARLLFYHCERQCVFKTQSYRNPKLLLVQRGFATYLTGVLCQDADSPCAVYGREIFSQTEVELLCP